jgi:hypothetical protein
VVSSSDNPPRLYGHSCFHFSISQVDWEAPRSRADSHFDVVAAKLADVEGDFAGLSLRAGFVTATAQKKVPGVDIMRV